MVSAWVGWSWRSCSRSSAGRPIRRRSSPRPLSSCRSIAHCGDAAQQARWLEGVAAGSITGALALGADTVTAEATDGGWRLNGSVRHVVDGDRADEIAVVATVMDENGDGAPAVFVVERTTAGLTAERTPTFDYVAHIADVTLHDVVVAADRRLAAVDVAGGVERTVAEATLGWAIPTVGACQRILDMTVDYVKERHQFGVPIGSFQAVKHKAVDMYVAIERARAVCQYAALVLAEGRSRMAHGRVDGQGRRRRLPAGGDRHGIQLFGGIGFTWENDLQISVRRAKLGEVMFGSAAEHRRRHRPGGTRIMKLTFPPEVEAVRAEFSAWLDEHLPAPADTTAAFALVRRRAAVGAHAAGGDVRRRLAAPRAAARVRWPQRPAARAVRHPGRTRPVAACTTASTRRVSASSLRRS